MKDLIKLLKIQKHKLALIFIFIILFFSSQRVYADTYYNAEHVYNEYNHALELFNEHENEKAIKWFESTIWCSKQVKNFYKRDEIITKAAFYIGQAYFKLHEYDYSLDCLKNVQKHASYLSIRQKIRLYFLMYCIKLNIICFILLIIQCIMRFILLLLTPIVEKNAALQIELKQYYFLFCQNIVKKDSNNLQRENIIKSCIKNKNTIPGINKILISSNMPIMTVKECLRYCLKITDSKNKKNLLSYFGLSGNNDDLEKSVQEIENLLFNNETNIISSTIRTSFSLIAIILFLLSLYIFWGFGLLCLIFLYKTENTYDNWDKMFNLLYLKYYRKFHNPELLSKIRYYFLYKEISNLLILEKEKKIERAKRKKEKAKMKLISYWEQYWSEKQQDISGADFENAVGDLYRKLGYKVTITKGTGDGGVDLILEKDDIIIIVQCKAHKNQVGPEPLRALWGVREDFNATHAIFIAYSGVTSGAQDFARNKNLTILDAKDLIDMSLNMAKNDKE